MNEARRYERAKFAVGITGFFIDIVLLIYLLTSGWTFRIRDFAGSAGSDWGLVLVYSLIVGGLLKVIGLPLSFYSGFVLEHKFGLSRQSFAEWAGDMLKAALLSAALGIGAIQVIYYLLRAYPDQWWVYASVIFAGFVIVMANLAPVLLLPLFFKFKPVDNAELQRRVERLAARTRTRLCGIFEWSLGDKTRKANAAVVGWGNTRRIIVSDTMLRNFTPEEVEVVMAHELCHHVKNHIWLGMAVQAGLTFAGFYAAHRILSSTSAAAPFLGVADIANLPVLILTAALLGLLALPLVSAFSRGLERAADRYALDLTGDALAFVSSMEKLADLNLANKSPNKVVEFIFYSHPSVEERIKLAADRVGQNV
jgi:STE24 endopeptidase